MPDLLKIRLLNDHIATHKYDLMAFSETWLNSADDNDPHIISLLPDGSQCNMLTETVGNAAAGSL